MRLSKKRRYAIALMLIPLLALAILVAPRVVRAIRRWDTISVFPVGPRLQLQSTPVSLGDVWLTRPGGELVATGLPREAMSAIAFDDNWLVLILEVPGKPEHFVIIDRANGRVGGLNQVPAALAPSTLDQLRQSKLDPRAFMDKYGTP